MSDGSPQEGRVIDMPSSPLCEAEDALSFTVNWNRKTGGWESCHLSGPQAAALYDELAELRQKVQSNWETVEDVCIGTQVECVKCENLKPCMCDKK